MPRVLERQLAELKLGDHVCPLYESTAEQMAVVVAIVKEGLARGERCLYVADDHAAEKVAAALTTADVDVAGQRGRGALRFLTKRESYLKSDEFDPQAMISFLGQAETEALAEGFSGLRVTGDMRCALGPEAGCDRLIEYEVLLNQFFADSRTVMICQYDRTHFDPAIILNVLWSHPVAVIGDQVCPNPFYEPPKVVLGKAPASERVDWKIAQLKRVRAMERAAHENQAVLRAIMEGANDSQALMRAIMEGVNDAIFAKDRRGRYLMMNSAGARFLGKSVEQVIGKHYTELFAPETAAEIVEDDRRIMAGGETETFEQVATAAGVTRTFLTTKSPYRDTRGNIAGVIGIARDVTDAVKLKDDRDRLLERLRLQIDRLPLAYILIDSSHRVLDWNPAAETMFGYTKEEALGRVCLDLIPPPLADDRIQEVIRRVEAGEMQAHLVNDNRTKDGRIITCQWLNTPLMDPDGKFGGAISLAQDVTERRRSEKEMVELAHCLQLLSARLVEAQEVERRHLARKLHDEIGQILGMVSVNLQAAKSADGAGATFWLDESIGAVDHLIGQLRDLAIELRPSMLDDLGLVSTLRWYSDRQAQRAGFVMHFAAESTGARLPADREMGCYRVFQEALTNVGRHARADHVWIDFRQNEEYVQMVIRDDGIGFDVAGARHGVAPWSSLGLLGMRERVELLGGEFDIESKPTKGTIVRVRIPLTNSLDRDVRIGTKC